MIVRENIVSISLSDLRSVGVFDTSNLFKTIPVIIKKNNETYHLNVSLGKSGEGAYIRFSYIMNGKELDYQIPLIQVPNPITGGYSFYFEESGRKCRKLFLNGLYFRHSSTISKMYYYHDTLPVSIRGKYREMKSVISLEQRITGRSIRYYKSHYKQMLTKKHVKVMLAYKELQNQIA